MAIRNMYACSCRYRPFIRRSGRNWSSLISPRMRRITWSVNCAVRSFTNAASNSSYRYMVVLSEMLAIEARGRRPGGADALADTVRIDRPVAKLHRLDLEGVDAHCFLGGGHRGIARFGLVLEEDARLRQVLHPLAALRQINRRAADQFVARQDIHVTPP